LKVRKSQTYFVQSGPLSVINGVINGVITPISSVVITPVTYFQGHFSAVYNPIFNWFRGPTTCSPILFCDFGGRSHPVPSKAAAEDSKFAHQPTTNCWANHEGRCNHCILNSQKGGTGFRASFLEARLVVVGRKESSKKF